MVALDPDPVTLAHQFIEPVTIGIRQKGSAIAIMKTVAQRNDGTGCMAAKSHLKAGKGRGCIVGRQQKAAPRES